MVEDERLHFLEVCAGLGMSVRRLVHTHQKQVYRLSGCGVGLGGSHHLTDAFLDYGMDAHAIDAAQLLLTQWS